VPNTPKSDADERQVEELARELAGRLRSMDSRQELTDYAVSLLRESAEEANQEEQARVSVERAASGNLNTIAFGLPLGVIGVVLCATGILAGPGLIILGAAAVMVIYGAAAALLIRPRSGPKNKLTR
jgi:hypothetical protein